MNLTRNSNNVVIAADLGVRNKRMCFGITSLHVNNGLDGVQGGFVSRFVISADMRYPALAAGYQGGGAHVPYRETGRHVVCRGYYTISHYGGQTLNKRGRSCAICPCFCYTCRGADLECGYPRQYRWPASE